ncbi:protein GrpE [Polymorphobacter glacialis]|uniref:Protein GrpE n=1 Tax=Sandarakinorhabdus glacialis TaxID=1614636 RepID=A0A916ZRR7_9SPHN|nr:nucleotide exchange factor GrpE [Polymorphobacter glacialis]GGE08253.1 protein GrpE [Polymorphobacter glacialis]
MNDMNDAPEQEQDDALNAAPEVNFAEELLARDTEIADLKDRLLRQAAETENTRRRLERDKADTAAYAMTGFARDLLAVADNLRRAVAALPAEGFDNVRAGIEATERELSAIFGRHGITRVETAGQKLDPNKHQAMIEVEHETHAPGAIVDELQAGYLIKDRLLRPALVSVAKAKG